jgi:curved DNA-binding protein CbpA
VFKNHYSIINLPNFSSKEEVKIAFWKLAKLYHPDTSTSNNTSLFLEIKAAYDILSDEEKKQVYDEMLLSHIEKKHGKRTIKIRADKAWIAKYKAEQKRIKDLKQPIDLPEKDGRNHHYLLILLCVVIAILLLFTIIQ